MCLVLKSVHCVATLHDKTLDTGGSDVNWGNVHVINYRYLAIWGTAARQRAWALWEEHLLRVPSMEIGLRSFSTLILLVGSFDL